MVRIALFHKHFIVLRNNIAYYFYEYTISSRCFLGNFLYSVYAQFVKFFSINYLNSRNKYVFVIRTTKQSNVLNKSICVFTYIRRRKKLTKNTISCFTKNSGRPFKKPFIVLEMKWKSFNYVLVKRENNKTESNMNACVTHNLHVKTLIYILFYLKTFTRFY